MHRFTGADRLLALVILALTVLSLWAGLRKSKAAVNTEGSVEESRSVSMAPQIVFSALLLAIFAFVLFEGLKNSYLAALMPVIVAILGGASVLAVLVMQARGAKAAGTANFDQEASATDAGPWPFVGWAMCFLGLTLLVGFFAALAAFFVAFLRVVARCGWVQTLLLSGAACGFILILAASLNLIFPGGLLQEYYDLPWPLR